MTSVIFYLILLHTIPSIVTQFSTFKIFYADIFHTLPCYMSNHATSKALNFKNCKSVTCRYSFNFLNLPAVKCFVTISIAFQTVTIEPLRRTLLLFNYLKLFYNSLTLSFFNTRVISKTSSFLTSLLWFNEFSKILLWFLHFDTVQTFFHSWGCWRSFI